MGGCNAWAEITWLVMRASARIQARRAQFTKLFFKKKSPCS